MAGLVNLLQLLGAGDDVSAGRKVRTFDGATQFARGELLALQQRIEQAHGRRHDLFWVVGRDVGRHADRDAGGTIDQHVRDGRRQDHGLFLGAVVVRPEMHGIFVDLAQDLVGEGGEPALGVTVGRRRVAVERAEVAGAVDERRAKIERLGHAHERVVNRGVAVRVIAAHHVAHDFRALSMLGITGDALLPHRVQDAPLHGLQAVAHVGDGAARDHGQRVVQVAGLCDLVQGRRLFVVRRRFVAAAWSAAPLLGRFAASGGVLLALVLTCRQRFAFPDLPSPKVGGSRHRARFASFLSGRKSISSEEMAAGATKALRFAIVCGGLALLPLACRHDPAPAPDQASDGWCAADGVLSSRNLDQPGKGELAAEIVQTCGDCSKSARLGAPVGAPCSAPSVCTEFCCDCPNSFKKSYRARACDAGHCAGPSACSSTRAAIQPDVCR